LYRKLTLASTYEIPSSIEDNRNSRTYALKIGENRTTFYPPNHLQSPEGKPKLETKSGSP
jgi:hypothetical protein